MMPNSGCDDDEDEDNMDLDDEEDDDGQLSSDYAEAGVAGWEGEGCMEGSKDEEEGDEEEDIDDAFCLGRSRSSRSAVGPWSMAMEGRGRRWSKTSWTNDYHRVKREEEDRVEEDDANGGDDTTFFANFLLG